MIEIILDDDCRYQITADKYNVTLTKAYYSKKNESWLYNANYSTHHGSLKEAIMRIVKGEERDYLSHSEIQDAFKIIDKIDKLKESLLASIKTLPEELLTGESVREILMARAKDLDKDENG